MTGLLVVGSLCGAPWRLNIDALAVFKLGSVRALWRYIMSTGPPIEMLPAATAWWLLGSTNIALQDMSLWALGVVFSDAVVALEYGAGSAVWGPKGNTGSVLEFISALANGGLMGYTRVAFTTGIWRAFRGSEDAILSVKLSPFRTAAHPTGLLISGGDDMVQGELGSVAA